MWRDRTNLYISYRQSYTHHPAKSSHYASNGYSDNPLPEERRGLMSAGATDESDAVIEMDVLPPRWLDIQDEVNELLAEINKKTVGLDSLHSKHVLPGFEDDAVKKKEEREIERVTQDITRDFQSCQRAVKRVESMVKESKHRGDISSAEETMARNLQISLASRVGEVSARFRKKQSNYLKKLRALSGLGTPTDGHSTPIHSNPYADPSLLESDADRSLSQSTLRQTQSQKRPGGSETMIAQREKEIEDIAQGIIDLANMFQELQTMVIDQGTMLDRVDYNVERMATDVKEADKELTVATGYQKKTTRRKIILLLILIIIGLFILLLVKPRRRADPAPKTGPDPVSDSQSIQHPPRRRYPP